MPSVITTCPERRKQPVSSPWKAWSIHPDYAIAQRKICGLLNRITDTNFDSCIAMLFQFASSSQRNGNDAILTLIANGIIERAAREVQRHTIYIELCCVLHHSLRSECGGWGSGTARSPSEKQDPFLVILLQRCRIIFDQLLSHQSQQLSPYCCFLGSLHLRLPSGCIAYVIDSLFDHTLQNNEVTLTALNHLIRTIEGNTDGPRHLEDLNIIPDLQSSLQGCKIQMPQTRNILMGLFDHCSRPSVDAYQLDDCSNDDESFFGVKPEGHDIDGDEGSYHWCKGCTDTFFTSGSLKPAENYLNTLPPERHHILIDCLLHAALSSNTFTHARQVSLLFTLPSVLLLIESGDTFSNGFAKELKALDDTALDYPQAYQLMAFILYACARSSQPISHILTSLFSLEGGCDPRLSSHYREYSESSRKPSTAENVEDFLCVEDSADESGYEGGGEERRRIATGRRSPTSSTGSSGSHGTRKRGQSSRVISS